MQQQEQSFTFAELTSPKWTYWAEYMAELFCRCSHSDHELSMVAAKAEIIKYLRGLPDECNVGYGTEGSKRLRDLYFLFDSLVQVVLEFDSQCRVNAQYSSDKLTLTWRGQWTENRWVELSIPHGTMIAGWCGCYLQFNTGTGKESNFLKLPSVAVKESVEVEHSTIKPLVCKSKLVADVLGITPEFRASFSSDVGAIKAYLKGIDAAAGYSARSAGFVVLNDFDFSNL